MSAAGQSGVKGASLTLGLDVQRQVAPSKAAQGRLQLTAHVVEVRRP